MPAAAAPPFGAALARAGEADRACRIAAPAWAALREGRPDLAAQSRDDRRRIPFPR
jgi:hypothetical protein